MPFPKKPRKRLTTLSVILAVVLVIYLVKKVFKNFDLDDDEEEGNVNG